MDISQLGKTNVLIWTQVYQLLNFLCKLISSFFPAPTDNNCTFAAQECFNAIVCKYPFTVLCRPPLSSRLVFPNYRVLDLAFKCPTSARPHNAFISPKAKLISTAHWQHSTATSHRPVRVRSVD